MEKSNRQLAIDLYIEYLTKNGFPSHSANLYVSSCLKADDPIVQRILSVAQYFLENISLKEVVVYQGYLHDGVKIFSSFSLAYKFYTENAHKPVTYSYLLKKIRREKAVAFVDRFNREEHSLVLQEITY